MKIREPAIFIFFWLIISTNIGYAQFENTYTPRKTFDKNSKDLIANIHWQFKREMEETPIDERKIIESYFELKTKYLIHLVKSGYVIDDEPLQSMVESIFDQLVLANKIEKKPRVVLIIKSPIVNATCYGDGIFAISVGLLSRMENNSQLAFVLAHELAHYQRDHVKEKILQLEKSDYQSKVKSSYKRIWESDEISPDQIEEIQKLVYETKNYSREKEYEADAIGFEYLTTSGFAEQQGLRALDKLDSANYSKHTIGLRVFLPLDNKNFLLQPEWMRNRLSIYSKPPAGSLILSNDSLKSHPDIRLRKERLAKSIVGTKQVPHNPNFEYQIDLCDFEVVESMYWLRQADRALFEALELLSLYPENAYLISTISKILIRVYELKASLSYSIYIPTYTYEYDETLLLVNNFLQNTTAKQIGEIAYHFLNNQSNFTPDFEEQYYLLWKICSLTARKSQKNEIRSEYKHRFPNGSYLGLMKESHTLSDAMKKLGQY